MDLFWLFFIFVFGLGACVGSFLNVVIYRLPEGRSIVTPPSSCPQCGHGLAWHDNVPVLGWLWLRGKCRYCRNPISIQYPIVEAVTAALFAGLYYTYFATDLRPAFGQVPQMLERDHLLTGTWPIFVIHLFLLGSLLAATLIDAKYYIIPLDIPWLATGVALVGLPAAVALGSTASAQAGDITDTLIPFAANGTALLGAAGGVAGIALSIVLLRMGIFKRSFADEHAYLSDDGHETTAEVVAAYPHARREMLKELMFVSLPLLGLLIGFYVGHTMDLHTRLAGWPSWVFALGGVVCGYLTGAGLVWFTRIFGTLAFGKEAMGLGDVHLLAAIGAVLGPIDTVLAFFIAPFMGLKIYAVMMIAGGKKDEPVRVIPYGPFLAAGALVVMVSRNELLHLIVG